MGQVAICTVASPFLLRYRLSYLRPEWDLKPLRLRKSKSLGNQIQEICVWITLQYGVDMILRYEFEFDTFWILNYDFDMVLLWIGYGLGYDFDMVLDINLIWCGNGASFSEFPMGWIRNQKRKQPGHAFGRFLEFWYDVDWFWYVFKTCLKKSKQPPQKKTHTHTNHTFDPHQNHSFEPHQNHSFEPLLKPYQNHNCKTRPQTNHNSKSFLNHIIS